MPFDFRNVFERLTGYAPFPWQEALYERFRANDVPDSCNIPTGLGKTNVIVVWLAALINGLPSAPRRLIYVVNRRTVVDQTTDIVMGLRKRLKESNNADIAATLRGLCAIALPPDEPPLAASTLRGQLADNRAWAADPARPAVICGTVDMIGSRLLFSGYGVGFKARPLHAGFLGQDALLVHDEAHLEPAFQRLIEDIECEQRCRERDPGFSRPKLRVMQLTATRRNRSGGSNNKRSGGVFELASQEMSAPTVPEPKEGEPPIHRVWRRLKAAKHLHLKQADDDAQIPEEISDRALDYIDSNAAVILFVRTLEDVKRVYERLTNGKTGVKPERVQLLIGTMRGLERDRMVRESRVFKRFQTKTDGETVYLLCTSAGEVGVDISADHMICDLSTFDSMAQRLGRVHRYGEPVNHVADVHVVYPVSFGKKDKKTGELKADEIERRRQKTLELLRDLPRGGQDRYDASPSALGSLDPERRLAAFSPDPVFVDAHDILFDAWSMTTIRAKLPGRPEVEPYLHGIAEDAPQTTITWRTELDLLQADLADESKARDAAAKLKAIFAKHRIRPHESATVRSVAAVEFLKGMADPKVRTELLDARVALLFARNVEVWSVRDLVRDPAPLNAEPTLVLPASFGGLGAEGMLTVPKPTKKPAVKSERSSSEPGTEPPGGLSLDVADEGGYERDKDAPRRMRALIERGEEGWIARPLPKGDLLPAEWDSERTYARPRTLANALAEEFKLRVRLMAPLRIDDEGETDLLLVCLSPPPQKGSLPREQLLDEHVDYVSKAADALAEALLKKDPVVAAALRFAAKYHDEGKKADRWQRYIGRRSALDPYLGKSKEWRDPRMLAGYRHEFGSLLRITDALIEGDLSKANPPLSNDDLQAARELALHMIAAHHGYARPHFPSPWDEDVDTNVVDQRYLESLQRFARLQRHYGRWGLAYLESLLRAADWAASRIVGADPEVDDDDPEEASL